MKKTILFMAAGSICAGGFVQCKSPAVYPKAPTSETVDEYFGIKVADPYRPLENDTSAETLEWVKEENAVTEKYLSAIPFRDSLRERLTELNNYRKTGLPTKENDGRYYYFENDGLKNQSVLYRKDSLNSQPEVFLDPNTLSDDGTVALTGVYQSKNGKYTAYTVSRSGSDWTEIFVMDTQTKKLLDDHIEWTKFTSAEWDGDGGFYYSTYPRPEAGKEFSNANENHRIFYHRMGTPQSDDQLVFEDKEHPLHFHSAQVPDGNENLLFVYDQGAGIGSGMRMLDKRTGKWTVIENTQDYPHRVLGVVDDTIYILTTYGAPKKRLMTASVSAPQRENWKVLVPENDNVLVDATFSGDKLLLT